MYTSIDIPLTVLMLNGVLAVCLPAGQVCCQQWRHPALAYFSAPSYMVVTHFIRNTLLEPCVCPDIPWVVAWHPCVYPGWLLCVSWVHGCLLGAAWFFSLAPAYWVTWGLPGCLLGVFKMRIWRHGNMTVWWHGPRWILSDDIRIQWFVHVIIC
jgi:hypothetical protein